MSCSRRIARSPCRVRSARGRPATSPDTIRAVARTVAPSYLNQFIPRGHPQAYRSPGANRGHPEASAYRGRTEDAPRAYERTYQREYPGRIPRSSPPKSLPGRTEDVPGCTEGEPKAYLASTRAPQGVNYRCVPGRPPSHRPATAGYRPQGVGQSGFSMFADVGQHMQLSQQGGMGLYGAWDAWQPSAALRNSPDSLSSAHTPALPEPSAESSRNVPRADRRHRDSQKYSVTNWRRTIRGDPTSQTSKHNVEIRRSIENHRAPVGAPASAWCLKQRRVVTAIH